MAFRDANCPPPKGKAIVSVSANLVLALAVPIFVLAASLLRVYVTNGRVALIVVALILFTIGNTMMIRVMREMGLGVAISVATIAQFVLINIVAYVGFQERPTVGTARRAWRSAPPAWCCILLPRSSQ